MIRLVTWLQVALWNAPDLGDIRRSDDRGQTTAEYALVLLGAAAVAVLLLTWATRTNRLGKLFDFVMDQVVGRVT